MKHTFRPPTMLAAMALAVALAGCGDDVTDPDHFLDSAEAEAVIRSADALPTLPGLIERVADSADGSTRAGLLRAAELWLAGTAGDGADARHRRALAVRYAAPGLAALLPDDEWATVHGDLEAWAGTVETMLRQLSLPDVERRVQAARGYLDRARRSADASSRAALTLLAASELVETTPRHVARRLVAEATMAVGEAGRDARAGTVRIERATRLKDWAARAVEEESYLLAIQRAYYAIQLVEGR